MEYQYIPLVFVVGFIAGVINTLAGGGSLLTLPVLMFLGLPSSLANGTNRVAIWIQCVAAVVRFRKGGVSHWTLCLWLSLPACLGSVIGALAAVDLPDRLFKTLFAIIMLVVVAFIVWNPKPKGSSSVSMTLARKISLGAAFFLIGLYGGIFQAGAGYFLIAAFVFLAGLNLIETAAAKSLIVAIYTTFALGVFIWKGEVDWFPALILSLGNGLGGWIGGSLALDRGEVWIRWALIVTVIAMSMKLLGVIPSF
ncbi:MAG: TSUP family transporter [bacterium]|nr:TSUP family transporter [bacterium]